MRQKIGSTTKEKIRNFLLGGIPTLLFSLLANWPAIKWGLLVLMIGALLSMRLPEKWKIRKILIMCLVIVAAIVAYYGYEKYNSSFMHEGRPELRVELIERNLTVVWLLAQFEPSTDSKVSPFSFMLKNIGDKEAVDIEVTYEIALGSKDLLSELQTSKVFPNLQFRDNKFVIPLQISQPPFGLPPQITSSAAFGFENKVSKTYVALKDGSEAKIEYPTNIQDIMYAWALSKAFPIGAIRQSAMQEQINRIQQYNKEKTSSKKEAMGREVFTHIPQLVERFIFPCPDIIITITYHDLNNHNYSYQKTIRCIYEPFGATMWQHNDPQQINNMSFMGGMGVFAFEDERNPDLGEYNFMKRGGFLGK